MKTTYQRAALIIAVLCALLPAVAAAAADSYKINVITSLTGGASFLGKGEQAALELLKKSVNKTGGINGRDLEYVIETGRVVLAGRGMDLLGRSEVVEGYLGVCKGVRTGDEQEHERLVSRLRENL